jgi:hypothetical protein
MDGKQCIQIRNIHVTSDMWEGVLEYQNRYDG